MNYNGSLMKILEMIANMFIVSFFWLICCIPVVTIIPSSVALYNTSNKIIFNGRGKGVAKLFFNTFKDNIVLGAKVNLIYLVGLFFIIVGMYTGVQIYKWNIWGLLYLILGIIITLAYVISIINIPAVISKFYLNVLDTIRLSVYFALQNIFASLLNVILLLLFGVIVYLFPLAIFVVPALYIDFIKGGIEKKISKFINDNNLLDNLINEENVQEKEKHESLSEINNRLSRKVSK